MIYNSSKSKNKDGESLACWAQNIEQGRSSVQQALLPFYFRASEGVAPIHRSTPRWSVKRKLDPVKLSFHTPEFNDPALAGTPESEG